MWKVYYCITSDDARIWISGMRINQVEELVGITKKNIRFYEEQGLLSPRRNPENGYREYDLEDVSVLLRIKLLRKLSVPIEDIRMLQEGKLSFTECMEQQETRLGCEQRSLELTRELCSRLSLEVIEHEGLDAENYLEEIGRLEKEGTVFMDVNSSDVDRKKKYGAVISTVVVVALMVLIIGIVIWANMNDPIPFGVLAIILLIYGSIIVGVVIALTQRIKEIDKGEENEASKY